jgi:hypothetical protein
MSKREHTPSPIKPTPFSSVGNSLPSPIKHNYSSMNYDDTLSNKRQRPLSFENDQENLDPSQILSSPKKARIEDIKQELAVVDKNINELQGIKDHYKKFVETTSNSNIVFKELEAEKQKNIELQKALAASEAKALRRKEKKAERKKVQEEEKAKIAEFMKMLEEQEAERLKVVAENAKLKGENNELKKIIHTELKSEIDRYQGDVMELEEKIVEESEKLLEVNFHQNQMPFDQIVNLMEKVCSTPKSEKYSTQIKFSEGEAKLISIGRAPTVGKSKSQLAHTIPYGLAEHLVKRVIEFSETFDERMELLIQDILPFFKYDKGIFIRKSELDKFNLSVKNAENKAFASYKTCNDTYFLIEENYTNLIGNPLQKEQIEYNYAVRKQYFIRSVLTYLKDSIHDNNTKQFFCETLSSFILSLFNKKPNSEYPASYSTKGNISELEIRLYDDVDDARTPNSKYFEVVRACDLNRLIENGEDLNERIRIVANSGDKVKKALEGLSILNEIIGLVLDAEDPIYLIDKYNKFNTQIMFSNSEPDLSKYNSPLTYENFKTEIQGHIAKQAFVMCGYKALEDKVLVCAENKSAVKAYTKAKGNDSAFFEIKDGPTFRAEERKLAKASHPKRPEETDHKFLAHMIVKFIEILTLAYESFKIGFTDFDECYPLKLLQSFTSLIAGDQRIDYKQFFENYITPLAKEWIESDYSNGSFSEIECSTGYIPLYDDHQ